VDWEKMEDLGMPAVASMVGCHSLRLGRQQHSISPGRVIRAQNAEGRPRSHLPVRCWYWNQEDGAVSCECQRHQQKGRVSFETEPLGHCDGHVQGLLLRRTLFHYRLHRVELLNPVRVDVRL
jgi:hypothetical protein